MDVSSAVGSALTPRSSIDGMAGSSIHSGSAVDLSLHRSGSSSTRRASAWKRVSQLYSPRQRAADDEAADDLWDNNDEDFQRQVAMEATMDPANQVHVFTSSSLNASMEEVCSPTEQRRSFIESGSTPVHTSLPASSSTPALAGGASSMPGSPPSSSSPAARNGNWQQRAGITPSSSLYAGPDHHARPASAAGGSLLTSRSYSTVSSEASSALTYPSPGSSKAELNARKRLSGQQQGRLAGTSHSGSTDASPTGARFNTSDLANYPSSQQSNQNIQLSGWTHEQISSPGLRPVSQFITHPSHPTSSSGSTVTTKKSLADPAFIAPSIQPSARDRQIPTAAESVRDQALFGLKKRQANGWQHSSESSPQRVNDATSRATSYDKALPTPASMRSHASMSQSPASESGILAGLKKKILSGRRSKKAAQRAEANGDIRNFDSQTGKLTLTSDEELRNDTHDGQRRPSLPHLGTMPTVAKTRRLSMQTLQEKRPHHLSLLDAKHAPTVASNGRLATISSATSRHNRRPSVDKVAQRLFHQPDGSPHIRGSLTHSRTSSHNSIIEHTSFDEAKRRSGVWSTPAMQDPTSTHNLFGAAPDFSTSTAGVGTVSMDDAREELRGDADSSQAEDSDARSSISIHSAPHTIPPPRPPRYDEGETESRPSLDAHHGRLARRPSIEHVFNVAHDQRWSSLGSAFTPGGDGGSWTAESESADAHAMTANHGPLQHDLRSSMSSSRGSLLSMPEASTSGSGIVAMARVNSASRFEGMRADGTTSAAYSPRSGSARKTWARLSLIEPASNTLSSLLSGELPRKRSLANTASISQPTLARDTVSDELLSNGGALHRGVGSLGDMSPASDTFSTRTSSANRSSGGGLSTHRGEESNYVYSSCAADLRSTRSTNDLLHERPMSKASQRASIGTAPRPASGGVSTPKRPTFGLDLQPDAAAAFDSIPLPATPERSHSRTASISCDQLALPSPAVSTIGAEHAPLLAASESRGGLHAFDFAAPQAVLDDLPADVEDIEDLLDEGELDRTLDDEEDDELDPDRTIGDDTIKASPRADVLGSPSADEVELLQDDSGKGTAASAVPIANDRLYDASSVDFDEEASRNNLTAYRFPAPFADVSDKTNGFDSIPTPETTPAHNREARGDLLAHDAARRRSSSSSFYGMSPPPPPPRFVAAHLRRPSSSASFV